MSPLALFVVGSVAVYSIGRFIVLDELFAPVRKPLLTWTGEHGAVGRFVGKLLRCPFCVTFWVAAAITIGADLATSVPLPWLWPWALRGGAVIVWAYVDNDGLEVILKRPRERLPDVIEEPIV